MNFSFVYLAVFVFGSGVYGQDVGSPPSPPALTSFSCHGRPPGYYADLESGCKIYHVCDGNSHFTYVCPRRTLFQQRSRTCDHSYLVRCRDSDDDDENSYDELEILIRLEEETKTTEKENQNEYTETIDFTSTEDSTEISTTAFLPTSTLTTDTTETVTIPTTQEPTTIQQKEKSVIKSLKKFIKFRLKDFRSLFFIPEVENSVIEEPEKEFVLAIDGNDFLSFRNRRDQAGSGRCPSHCDLKFLLPGSCHPCITIK